MGGIRVQELKTWATPCSRKTAKYIGVRNSSLRSSTAYIPSPGKRGEELVEPVGESRRRDAAPRADRLKLEDERTGVIREIAVVRLVHRFEKDVRDSGNRGWPCRPGTGPAPWLKVCTVIWFHTLLTQGKPGGRCSA